jgi:transposase
VLVQEPNWGIAGVIGHDERPAPKLSIAGASAAAGLSRVGAASAPVKRRRTTMECFAGLDVSMDETAICVVDAKGNVLFTGAVVTDPAAIAAALQPFAEALRRVGHEAGALSPWLHPELKRLGLPAVCLEARHVRAAMAAQRNKTDAADALGLAHVVRTGWFRQAYVKSEGAYRLRLLLTHRRNLKRKFLDLENAIRHSLKAFGVRLHKVGRGGFDKAVRAACSDDPTTAELIDIMLVARAALWSQYLKLHGMVVRVVAQDEVCRRFMRIPGVGPIAALTVRTAIDDPRRFRRSRDVAAYFGLTSRRWQSGTSIDVQGRISKAGDADVRRALYEAATVMLKRYRGQTALKTWGLTLAKRKCHAKAAVAVARKLVAIMHAMWRDGSEYVAGEDVAPQPTGTGRGRKSRALAVPTA